MLLLCLLSCFSRAQLCVTPWTVPHQAPLSMGFSRQEYWSGLPFPSPLTAVLKIMWVSMWTLPSTQSQVAIWVKCPISSFTFDLGWVEGHLNNICMLYYCWDASNVCVTLLLEHTCNMYIVSLLEYYSAVKRDCTTTSLDGSQEPYSESCCVEWKVSSERSYCMLPFMRYPKNNKALKMADRLMVARSWDSWAGKEWGYLGACRGGLRSDGAVPCLAGSGGHTWDRGAWSSACTPCPAVACLTLTQSSRYGWEP